MLKTIGCSILGGDPFTDAFRGLYNIRRFWDLTNPQYCLNIMKSAYGGGCRAFDFSFGPAHDLFVQLRSQVNERIVGIANPTWLQGFFLEDTPLQYCRNRILKTITTGRSMLSHEIAQLIDEKLSHEVVMVFGFDANAAPLTEKEIAHISLNKDVFNARMKDLSEAEYVLIGGTDADWLFSLGREDLIVELAHHVREMGKIPLLICHYASTVLPAADKLDGLDVQAYAIPFNKLWSWFSLEATQEAVSNSKRPIIAFMPFGSGGLKADPESAIKFLAEQPNVISLLFGTTSADHARENASMIQSIFSQRKVSFQ